MGAPNRGIPGRPGCNPAPRGRRDAATHVQAAEKEETAAMERYSATGCRAWVAVRLGASHIGVRHCAEHGLHGGRMLFHSFQSFAPTTERGRGDSSEQARSASPTDARIAPTNCRQASVWLGSGAIRVSR